MASGTFTSHQVPHTAGQMPAPMHFQANMSSHLPAGGIHVPPGSSPESGIVGMEQLQPCSAGSVDGSNADITALAATVRLSSQLVNLGHLQHSTVATAAPASPISPMEEAGGTAG